MWSGRNWYRPRLFPLPSRAWTHRWTALLLLLMMYQNITGFIVTISLIFLARLWDIIFISFLHRSFPVVCGRRLFLTQLEKVLIFRHKQTFFLSLTGVPTDPQDTAWESAHFSSLTGVPTDFMTQYEKVLIFCHTFSSLTGSQLTF